MVALQKYGLEFLRLVLVGLVMVGRLIDKPVMSIVTLQLGQCGNQIGQLFFDTIITDAQNGSKGKAANEYRHQSLERFFNQRRDGRCSEARAISVDTEKKVVDSTLHQAKRTGTWRYPRDQQLSGRRGAGNNWADGFYKHGAKCEQEVLDLVQKELEKCDHFGGFCSLMSIGGGTGSGLGTRVTQALKDHISKTFLVNVLVWPHSTGEVIVQNYNAVLSLAHLSETADALWIFQNDKVRKIAQNTAQSSKVTFHNMNQVVSEEMAAALQPAISAFGANNILGTYLEHLVSHPDYKLLTSRFVPQVSRASLPFTTLNWPSLTKRASQMLLTRCVTEEGLNWSIKPSTALNRTVANLAVLRGKQSNTVDKGGFSSPELYPSWMPAEAGFTSFTQQCSLLDYEKSLSVLSNCQTPIDALDTMVQKAWGMFAMRAYTHWYTRYGMQEEEFIDCFAKLEQIISNYKLM